MAEHPAGSGIASGWNFQRKDAVYAVAILASFGGDRLIDHTTGANASLPVVRCCEILSPG